MKFAKNNLILLSILNSSILLISALPVSPVAAMPASMDYNARVVTPITYSNTPSTYSVSPQVDVLIPEVVHVEPTVSIASKDMLVSGGWQLAEWPVPTDGSYPGAAVMDASNNFLFLESAASSHKLGQLDARDGVVTEWTVPSSSPTDSLFAGLAVDGSGNVWFGLNHDNKLVKLDRSTNDFTMWTLPYGSHDQGVAGPTYFAVDSSGLVYFNEYYQVITPMGTGPQMARFDPETNVLKEWKVPIGADGWYGVAVDSRGVSYFGSTYAIGSINADTNTFSIWWKNSPYSSYVEYFSLAVDQDDNLFATSFYPATITKLNPATNAMSEWNPWGQSTKYLVGLAIDFQGRVLVSSPGSVGKLDASSNGFSEWTSPSSTFVPTYVSADSFGNPYFTDGPSNVIGRISPAIAGCDGLIGKNTVLTSDIGPCLEDGPTIAAYGVTLNCAGHLIYGAGAGVGIDFSSTSKVTIKNCRVAGFTWGIHALGASRGVVANNTIATAEIGIYLESGLQNTVQHNSIANTTSGIVLSGSYAGSVTSNVVTNSTIGYWVQFSSSNVLRRNVAQGTRLPGAPSTGFTIYFASGSSLVGNTARGLDTGYSLVASGVSALRNNIALDARIGYDIENSSWTTMIGNFASDCDESGFNLVSTSNSRLTGNLASRNPGWGFSVSEGTSAYLGGNAASNNALGGFSISTNGSQLVSNSAIDNDGTGFLIDHSNSSTLRHNIALHNTQGFQLASSTSNSFVRNTARFSHLHGIVVDAASSSNTLTSNSVTQNGGYGFVDLSSGTGTANTQNTYVGNTGRYNALGESYPYGIY